MDSCSPTAEIGIFQFTTGKLLYKWLRALLGSVPAADMEGAGSRKSWLTEEEVARRDAVLAKEASGETLTREEVELFKKEKQRRYMLDKRTRVAVDDGGASGSGAASGKGSGPGHQARV